MNAPADDAESRSLLDRLRDIDVASALALLCFSLSLLFLSIYQLEPFIKPIAALGVLAGLLGGTLPALWRGRNAVLPALLSILCLLVLFFAGSWPSFSTPPPALVRIPLKQQGMAANQPVGEDDWVDASANALKRGDVRVEIVSASLGRVELKGKSSSSTSERFLTIRLRVNDEGIVFQQTPYEPWSDRPEALSKHPPTLTDNQGRSYAQKTLDTGSKVAGRGEGDVLIPGRQLKEVLVYPLPASGVQQLRLILPASAFGRTGAFRFQIPRSMIGGL